MIKTRIRRIECVIMKFIYILCNLSVIIIYNTIFLPRLLYYEILSIPKPNRHLTSLTVDQTIIYNPKPSESSTATITSLLILQQQSAIQHTGSVPLSFHQPLFFSDSIRLNNGLDCCIHHCWENFSQIWIYTLPNQLWFLENNDSFIPCYK